MSPKKWIFLCAALLLCITGCVTQEPGPTVEVTLPEIPPWTSGTQQTEEYEVLDPWRENVEAWGTPQTCTVTNAAGSVTYACNIPEARIVDSECDSVFLKTDDDRVIVLGAPDEAYPEATSLEAVPEAYKEELLKAVVEIKRENYEEYSITVAEQEMVEINGRHMVQFRCRMTYGTQDQYEWVILGYATELSNGAYAYFLAAYLPNNNYVGLKKIAENLANSFTEVTP